MQKFRVLDHDADIRIEVYGASRNELFENAAKGIFSLLTDPASVRPVTEKKVVANGNGELLVNFLNELLFVWDVERFIPVEIAVDFVPDGVSALLKGEDFDESRHLIRLEMKAVTYHNFSMTRENGTYKATFVIDV
ncbi:MAG: archease [Syntrophorhabdaceae bacterium]|nr:archease [Syntrophorhabdaceae bacterium]MDD4195946.1 archease [Syntrophorhabdaceae bacterium]HOC46838.1 archease [Syntrophorhabdaceae bacterium]